MKKFYLSQSYPNRLREGTISKIGKNAKAFGGKALGLWSIQYKRSGLYSRVIDLLRKKPLKL
jgi:hypothetical protein